MSPPSATAGLAATGSALAVGLTLMATAVPSLIVGLLAGVYVDLPIKELADVGILKQVVPTVATWMPIEERYPEPGQLVLFAVGGSKHIVSTYRWDEAAARTMWVAGTCWAPLPEAPGES